jgi:hypothetical protein
MHYRWTRHEPFSTLELLQRSIVLINRCGFLRFQLLPWQICVRAPGGGGDATLRACPSVCATGKTSGSVDARTILAFTANMNEAPNHFLIFAHSCAYSPSLLSMHLLLRLDSGASRISSINMATYGGTKQVLS